MTRSHQMENKNSEAKFCKCREILEKAISEISATNNLVMEMGQGGIFQEMKPIS